MDELAHKVIITRPAKDAQSLDRKLKSKGFETLLAPLIQLKLPNDLSEIKKHLGHIEEYDWIIFTSPNSVSFFFEAIEQEKVKLYYYPNLKFATVGEKTKLKLEELGYRTNFVPIKFTSQVLAENIPDIQHTKIFIPTSNLSKLNYVNTLEQRGAEVITTTLYMNELSPIKEEIEISLHDKSYKYITFCSGSAIQSFHKQIAQSDEVLSEKVVVSIGPSTTRVAQNLGLKIDIEANPHTEDGIVEAILKHRKGD